MFGSSELGVKFDTYSYKARISPAYLTLTPVIFLLVAVVPEGFELLTGMVMSLILVPVSFLLGQVSADFGKRLEGDLWKSWDGPPTTRFLRYGNGEFNEVTRGRVHAKLRQLGLHVPTLEEQKQDSLAADRYYESCTEEITRRTRDTKSFPLVYKGLIGYGFRRNLRGLKYFGILLSLTGVGGSAWSVYGAWREADKLLDISLVSGIISAGFLLVWLLWVTKHTVKLSANRYARFIFEAVLNQE